MSRRNKGLRRKEAFGLLSILSGDFYDTLVRQHGLSVLTAISFIGFGLVIVS